MDSQQSWDIGPAFDPTLTAHARQRLMRLMRRSANPGDKLAVEFIGPIAVLCCIVGAIASDLAPGWVFGLVISSIGTIIVHRRVTSSELRRYRHQFIEASALDPACQQLLRRTQRAIDGVLSSGVYADGLLGHAAGETELGWHEWEIATRLRDITRLRDMHASNSAASARGPQAAAVLDKQLLALTIAQEYTNKRITELERYAARVRAADAAREDWQNAVRLSSLNDKYLDLVARTAADERAIEEITILIQQAVAAEEVFRDSLHQATLAAEALAFPIRED